MGRRPSAHASGTNTPRDLNSNIKLLELYTLHVLPRNNEWDYAREFILMSEVLDDERKEAFLQALHGLKEEQEGNAKREKELQKLQREQLEEQRRQQAAEEARRREEEDMARQRRREQQRPPDETPSSGGAPTSPSSRPRPSGAIPSSSSKKNTQVSRPAQNRASNQPSRNTPAQNQTLLKRAAAMFASLQTLVLNMGQGMAKNPMAMMRMLLFLLMFAFAFGRRDVRERIKRVTGKAWDKIAATVGMGTKVSYI